MTQAALLELADRVEKAEGSNRELDALIWLNLPEQEGHAWKHAGDKAAHATQIAGCEFVPAYCASLDAAMTLVPEGCVASWDGVERVADVHKKPRPDLHGYQRLSRGRAATPALALLAACLRAQAEGLASL